MKKILALLCCAAVVLAGCMDTFDEMTIRDDGSGSFRSTVNLDKIFDIMEMAASMDSSAERSFRELSAVRIDTMLRFAADSEQGRQLSADDRRLLEKAKVHFILNKQEGKFRFLLDVPFADMKELDRLLALQSSGKLLAGFGDTHSPVPSMNSIFENKDGQSGIADFSKALTVTTGNGFVERRVDTLLVARIKNSPQMRELGDGSTLLESVTYRTQLSLPRPVKKVTGETHLSNDKRTVTLSYNLGDLLTKPNSLAFRIEY